MSGTEGERHDNGHSPSPDAVDTGSPPSGDGALDGCLFDIGFGLFSGCLSLFVVVMVPVFVIVLK